VAGFVGDHADHLTGVLGGEDQPGVDENPLAAADEGVERRILNQTDFNHRGVEAGRGENWFGELADDMFGFRVADKA